MTEQQIPKLVASLVEHQNKLAPLSKEDGQWVIQNTTDAIALFIRAIQGRQETEPRSENILDLVSTVTIPATTEEFIARDHFVVDTSKKAKVKISYLGDNFRKNFLGKTEEVIPEITLRYHKLRKSSVDKPIIAELGGEKKAETTLAEMFALMEMQPNGEKGALPTNGYANIFYIYCPTGVLSTVRCSWGGVGWSVGACSVEAPDGWDRGSRVFSRNSSES